MREESGASRRPRRPARNALCRPPRSKMEATGGFEPPNKGFADLSLNHLGTSPSARILTRIFGGLSLMSQHAVIGKRRRSFVVLPPSTSRALLRPSARPRRRGSSSARTRGLRPASPLGPPPRMQYESGDGKPPAGGDERGSTGGSSFGLLRTANERPARARSILTRPGPSVPPREADRRRITSLEEP